MTTAILNVPDELKQYRQWVLWRYEIIDGRNTKVPYQTNGIRVDVTNSKTWASLNAVSTCCGNYDGIGFVVTDKDDLWGVDLDHCRNPLTGEINQPELDIINLLDSYTEITPSMEGVRVWLRGKKPSGKNRKGHIEIYDENRYFTVTGNHLAGTPTTIEARQAQLNQLHAAIFPPEQKENKGNGQKPTIDLADTELLQKAMAARNGATFKKLWNGDTSEYDGDDSRADLALCSMLAFWTGNNQDRIDTLFRQSGLYREKWERKDYRERTITKAIENNHDTYKPGYRENQNNGHKPDGESGLPVIIITNRNTKEITADGIKALLAANNPPILFKRGAQPVRIRRDEHDTPFIEIMTEAAMRGRLDRVSTFVKVVKVPDAQKKLDTEEDEYKPIPVAIPKDVAQDLMTFDDFKLPALLSITEIPTLRTDGSIILQEGYDPQSSLFYAPENGLVIPQITDNPTSKEIADAKSLINEVYCDFPYDTQASRANMIAATATPIYRAMINGPTPICIITKPQAGTGAGLSTEAMSIITTGREAAMMGAPQNEEEWEKKLLSILKRGQAVIVIDNVDGSLYSPTLSRFITANTVQGRILGQTQDIILPNRSTWVATGNNVILGGDLPRRSYLVMMETQGDRPWERNIQYKHDPIIPWVRGNRGRIIAAYLTIAKAWIAAGKPLDNSLPRLGSFEDWVKTIGGIFKYVGIEGFLGNAEIVYQISDTETSQWEAFAEVLDSTFKNGFIVADIVGLMHKKDNDTELSPEGEDLLNSLPDMVDRDPRKINKSLGKALTKKNRVKWHNGLMIFNTGKKSHKVVLWKIGHWQDENQNGGLEQPTPLI